ncbi:LytR/AlgR family response regulator transcription factor [Myroides phaeus]|uniref:DNA-binding response regulator, LytR/AlgR family n=1 Tax=Myroides phaeus TaxID=702745 RepID=A0A1G8F0F3_9FLAO|nr:LytTR family DNA-binding domain-containing protein [Myroides phaeus]MEC4116811.1 LytTR family DNA-binding domain-containing protein [Myroides phaeus]SDH75499.1 DNA-binding response regulator, LytR/AlgR family [Myroides phaeus]
MKIAIVEDEFLASTYLKKLLLKQVVIPIEDIIILSSVREAILFFTTNTVDLIFMDIHLGDGKSLEIFEQVEVTTPIIFVTAFDSYAIQVFKQFTIDYILKPFEKPELENALNKFKNITRKFEITQTLETLVQIDEQANNQCRKRFLVNNGHKLKSIEATDIAYFFASGKHLFIQTFDNNSYIYDDTIKDIIYKLDDKVFFKINRKYIINRKAVHHIVKHNSQKIEVILTPNPEDNNTILVSKNCISELKAWLS